MLDVKTMRGSLVRAKIAGTESTANTMSVISRKSTAMKSGVACFVPSRVTKNFCPWSSLVTGMRFLNSLMAAFSSGSTPSSLASIMRMPV